MRGLKIILLVLGFSVVALGMKSCNPIRIRFFTPFRNKQDVVEVSVPKDGPFEKAAKQNYSFYLLLNEIDKSRNHITQGHLYIYSAIEKPIVIAYELNSIAKFFRTKRELYKYGKSSVKPRVNVSAIGRTNDKVAAIDDDFTYYLVRDNDFLVLGYDDRMQFPDIDECGEYLAISDSYCSWFHNLHEISPTIALCLIIFFMLYQYVNDLQEKELRKQEAKQTGQKKKEIQIQNANKEVSKLIRK